MEDSLTMERLTCLMRDEAAPSNANDDLSHALSLPHQLYRLAQRQDEVPANKRRACIVGLLALIGAVLAKTAAVIPLLHQLWLQHPHVWLHHYKQLMQDEALVGASPVVVDVPRQLYELCVHMLQVISYHQQVRQQQVQQQQQQQAAAAAAVAAVALDHAAAESPLAPDDKEKDEDGVDVQLPQAEEDRPIQGGEGEGATG